MKIKTKKVMSLILTALIAFACISIPKVDASAASGTWKSDSVGWWYSYSDGSYEKSGWKEIDGCWYYFQSNGYIDTYCYRDGSWLNADGAWNPAYSGGYWASDSTGWWYTDSSGWYPVSTWLKIDGSYYYFKANGYMAMNEWVDGSYVGATGAWIPNKVTVRSDLCDGSSNVKYEFSTTKADGWQSGYYNQVKSSKSKGGGSSKLPALGYFLCDIDGNSIPELFIKFGTCEADYSIEIYTYESGATKLLKTTGAGHTEYYSIPGGGYIAWWAHQGSSSIGKVTYSGGEFKTEEIYSETISNGADYKNPKDFISGAQNLTLINMKNPIGIVAYGVDNIPTGSASKNSEAKAKIQDVMKNNGKVYLAYTSYYETRSNKGIVTFNSLKNRGVLHQYTSLKFDHESWGDLNGDGQEECLVVFKATSKTYSGASAVLSYQNGQVYAYYIFDSSSDMYIENGKIVVNKSYGSFKNGIKFYKDLAYETYE